MIKPTAFLLSVCLFSASLMAEPVLDENKVRAISKEFTQSFKNKDFSAINKYIYPGSKIIIDVHPANNRGARKISYDQFLELSKMSMELSDKADVFEELISISVDRANNRATLKEKTTTIVEIKGKKQQDISVSNTTFGIVNGEIKVIFTHSRLISSSTLK